MHHVTNVMGMINLYARHQEVDTETVHDQGPAHRAVGIEDAIILLVAVAVTAPSTENMAVAALAGIVSTIETATMAVEAVVAAIARIAAVDSIGGAQIDSVGVRALVVMFRYSLHPDPSGWSTTTHSQKATSKVMPHHGYLVNPCSPFPSLQ